MLTLGLATVALLFSLHAVGATRRVALRWRLVDRAHERGGGPAFRAVPRLGGIGVAIGVCAAAAATAILARHQLTQIWPILALGLAVGAVGAIDDLRSLPAALKAGVLVVAGLVSWSTGMRIEQVGGLELAPWLGATVTVAWFVAIPTALNFVDGLDGLAAGLTVIASAVLAVIGLATGDAVMIAGGTVIGTAVVGFWHHNRHPARIFLGDGGAMMLGYWLAALALRGFAPGDDATAAATLLALGWPLIDFACAMTRRLRRRKPFSSDGQHLHHQLMRRRGHAGAVRLIHLCAAAAATVGVAFIAPEAAAVALATATAWSLVGRLARGGIARVPATASVAMIGAAMLLMADSEAGGGGVDPSAAIAVAAPELVAEASPGAEHVLP